MGIPIAKEFVLLSVLLLFVNGIWSSLLVDGQEGVILNSNHQHLGTFAAFLEQDDLFHSASEQIFQKIIKKADVEGRSAGDSEKQSTLPPTKESEKTPSSDGRQQSRPVRRFKVNPYDTKEIPEGKTNLNSSTRIVRVRKFKRKPLELQRTPELVTQSPENLKLTNSESTTILVPHIRVINSEERQQKRKKSKGRERTQKTLIPATNSARIFQPPTEASVPKSLDNIYKGLRLSNLPPEKQLDSAKPTNLRSSQSILVGVDSKLPKSQETSTSKQITSKPPAPMQKNDSSNYIPVLPATFIKTVNAKENPQVNKKQKETKDEENSTATTAPEAVHPHTIPIVRVPQQYYYNPYTVIPPQTLQRSVNFLHNPPVAQNAPLYGSMPNYFQPGIQQQPNNHPLFYPPQLSVTHPFLANPDNNRPYQGWSGYGLPGLQPSPHLTALRRSMWDEDAVEPKSDVEEPITPFTIPKFNMPSIDYNQDGCQTKIREVKEVPLSGHGPWRHGSHRRQKRTVKSVILTRECYFPNGVPTEEKEVLKEYVQDTIKTSGNSPKTSKIQENKEPQVVEKLDENKELLTASETKSSRRRNDIDSFPKSSGNEYMPKFKEPYFDPQYGYIFDE